jgi:hypothetical protein
MYIYIYIYKDGNPYTKGTRHVQANVNTQRENQNNQNGSNEVEDKADFILSHRNMMEFRV